jgi:hypothetical protein
VQNPAWKQKLPIAVIEEVAEAEELDATILMALAMQESGCEQYALRYEPNFQWTFRPHDFAAKLHITMDTELTSQKFSYGFCQIMLATARERGFDGPAGVLYGAKTNFTFGARQFKYCLKRWGLMADAVSAYNQGSPRKTKDGKYINARYVESFMFYWQEIKNPPRS